MNIETVNELIASLESAGELSIREQKFLKLVKAFKQLAAENVYLLNGAAREINTSWMFHKTMLGAQAALVCLAHGYQAAAREWLEGTTDEAGAEIPDDISVGELPEWFDSQMVSNDGKSGFLTRAEAEEAIKKACPATDRIVAGIKAGALPDNIAEIIDSGDLETICYESERSYAEDFRLALYNFRQVREGGRQMSIATYLNTGLAILGWAYIMVKTGQWIIKNIFSQWEKRRRESRRQKAVNEFYDAFELNSLEPGSTVRLATKGDLTIMMFRSEGKSND